MYFLFIHSQGGRLYIHRFMCQVLCRLLMLPKGFIPSVLNPNLMFLGSAPNLRISDRSFSTGQNQQGVLAFHLSYASPSANATILNPFGNMSSRHSTWPLNRFMYNLPPWLCMKRKYILMSLLIQGPKQPRNDIDVYSTLTLCSSVPHRTLGRSDRSFSTEQPT